MRHDKHLDRARLEKAFELLGEDLAGQATFIEIAVCGGSAIMLQFDWRRSTVDVDAVVREGYDEHRFAASVLRVANAMGLDPNWLNNAVGMYTPLAEDDSLFALAGHYPPQGTAGLRIVVAKPHYLLAMKLQALRSFDRGSRDLEDARSLAKVLNLAEEAELRTLYVSIHGEEPPVEVSMRFASVLEPS